MATVTEGTNESNNERRALTPHGKPNLRPWPKGVSGNPGGRPAGLAKRIKEATNDGADLVEFMTGVLGSSREKTADRIKAAEWLADRCWGRPQQSIELTRGDDDGAELGRQIEALTPAERVELYERIQARRAREVGEQKALPPAEANGS